MVEGTWEKTSWVDKEECGGYSRWLAKGTVHVTKKQARKERKQWLAMMRPIVVIKVHNTQSLSMAVQRRLLMMLVVVLAIAMLVLVVALLVVVAVAVVVVLVCLKWLIHFTGTITFNSQ
jgi:fatty-acid desaturase